MARRCDSTDAGRAIGREALDAGAVASGAVGDLPVEPRAAGWSGLPVPLISALPGRNATTSATPYCGAENVAIIVPTNHHQLCDQVKEIRHDYLNSCYDLAVWLALWKWITPVSHLSCLEKDSLPAAEVPEVPIVLAQLQWAIVLAQVFSTAVLPLFYGVLGAGAAVVRDIWREMRDSLLLPRDGSLSWGKLALGAVIGVSIGLFISPQSAAGSVPLTPSALSFVAGFGVEGVFVMLETLIKRVFNIQEPPRKTDSKP